MQTSKRKSVFSFGVTAAELRATSQRAQDKLKTLVSQLHLVPLQQTSSLSWLVLYTDRPRIKHNLHDNFNM